jgi:hypothetical protein
MTIVPTASATLGNLRYDKQIVALSVRLVLLPDIGTASVTLPGSVQLDVTPGDDAQVELGGVGISGDDGPNLVLTGTVTRIRRGFDLVSVEIADAGAALAGFRPADTYTAGSATDVVSALLDASGCDAGEVRLDLPLAMYVADQTRTAGEHVAALARLAGGLATVGADGAVSAVPVPTQPSAALKYGRDFTAYEMSERAAAPAQLVAVGAGAAGAPDAPDALRPTVEPLTGDGPDPGPDAVWRPEPVLRTPTAVSTASAALTAYATSWARRLHARCVLLPALRPGTVLDVQDVADGLWLLNRVEHHLTARAMRTEITGLGGPQ